MKWHHTMHESAKTLKTSFSRLWNRALEACGIQNQKAAVAGKAKEHVKVTRLAANNQTN